MVLRAGKKSVSLTESQERALGLEDKPERVGCGEDACVYAAGPDTVVKLTSDPTDALASWLLTLRDEHPQWAVPIHSVYRLSGNTFAIRATRVSRLPRVWADAIDDLFEFSRERDEDDDEDGADRSEAEPWSETYRSYFREIEWLEAEHGGATDSDRRMREALTLVDDAVRALELMGFRWFDYKAGNWGLIGDRPVIVDLGKLEPVEGDEASLDKRAKSIPVLPF